MIKKKILKRNLLLHRLVEGWTDAITSVSRRSKAFRSNIKNTINDMQQII